VTETTDERDREEPVTALVLLRPASGEEITGQTPITADTLARYAPKPADADRVARGFREAGFQVGPALGITMAVTAPRALFEGFFGVSVARSPDGGWVADGEEAGGRRDLPLKRLPQDLAARVLAVTFDEPAELVGP
jgi:hypothetical protein